MADSEDEETPPERDVKDFNFKQMRKIRMFESPTNLPNPRSSLLAVSTKYGLTFVGCPTGIKVIKTETIERINESDEGSMQNIVGHCPSSFIPIGHSVRFVGLSSDDLTLSVCCEKENQTVMELYDVPTLGSSNPSTPKFGETTLTSDAGVTVRNVLWNPGFSGIFAVCLSSGSVVVMELTEMEIKTLATLPGSVKANAICWSPKGKQLVVGHRDGRLTQYSQALEVKREIECPEVFVDDPHSVTDLLWITATLFAAVYSSLDEGDTPKVQLISAPKSEQRTITNFDDIYYVMGEEREPMYYLKNIAEWSMVVSACSNGFESAVIGKYGGETTTVWEKWNFEETGRAEMPLTNDNDETFPMGLAFDFSSTKPVIEGEKRLPPAPIMMLLSTDGVLCPFYMVNQTPNSDHSIITPVEPLPVGGQRKAIIAAGPLSTGTPGLAPKERVPSAPRTAGDLPAGAFAFVGTKQAFSSASGPVLSGLSFASYKQPVSFSSEIPTSATPASTPSSTFSFASSKQNVPLSSGVPSSGTSGDLPAGVFSFGNSKQTVSSSGNAPTSAFLSTNQKQPGLTATFKLPTQNQIPATESVRPSAGSPQIVKPTPSSQTQSVTPGLSSLKTPFLTTTSTAKRDDKPKASSTVPSQSTGQGLLTQPKPTLAKAAAMKAPPTRQDLYKEECSSLPEIKPTPQGFKLPGQSAPTEGVKRELNRKTTPVSKGNVIDASVSENIQEAINHFNTEMAKLCDNVNTMQSNCCLIDDNKDLTSLRKETEDVASKLTEIKRATKEQHKDIDDEKRKLLEAFEMLEDARIRQERKSDPRYVQLLKSRALDPVNTSKMREIRNLHLYLDKTLREVNMVLDEQWNKENERKRSIQRPALDEVYQTLKVHHRITQDQALKLEQITQEMKNRKLLSTSWQRSPLNTTSLREDLSSVRDPFAVSKQELKSPVKNVSAQISPQKQAQLRSMLQKRRSTPVRRSTVVRSTVTKTPLVKPSRPEVPFLSSTPAVRPEDTAEGSKGRFSFGDVPEEVKVSDDDGSLAEDGYQEEEPCQKKELEDLDAIHKASATALGPSPIHSHTTTSTTAGFSLGNTVDEAVLEKPSHPVRITAASESSHAKSIQQPTVVGAFSAVDKSVGGSIKPPGSQPTKAEPASAPSGLFLPATKTEPTTAAPIPAKSDFVPDVKVISTETPPNIAAAMAAMSRASASQGASQSGSNLDPSASIEPVTLVTYKPQAQGGAQPKDYDAENIAAKAIANAALMAATAEAQKSSTKPQCSTEFSFKSSDSSKPGPPVVTFKPPTANSSPPQIPGSASKVTAAPNVTVNPTPVFKPAFAPAVPSASTASSTGGLQKSFTGPQALGSFSFAPPTGGLPSFMASTVAASSATSAFSFSGKPKDPGPSQTAVTSVVAPSAAKPTNVITAPTAGITPSARVSRNLFAAGETSSAAAPAAAPAAPAAAASGEQNVKQEGKEVLKALQVTTANPSIASSSGIATLATVTQGFPFSAPTPAGEGFFKNLNLSTATIAGNVFGGGGGDTSSNPPSILSSLMRASASGGAAGNTSNLFDIAPTAVSNAPAPTSSTIPVQVSLPSKGTPSENKDTSVTPSGFPISTSAGGIFAQVLSESSKSNMVSSTTTTKTVPVPGSIFGAPATKPAFPPAGVFDLSLGGAKSSTTTSSTTTVAANPLSLSAGTASAFSATNTASPFFTSITPASTSASAPAGGSPLTSLPPPTITTTIASPSSKDSSASAASAGGLFSKVSTTASLFGAAVGTVSSGAGSVGAPTTTTGGNFFAAPTSTAFASTPVFGASTGSTFGSSPAPFSSPSSSQGSTFGSTPVFGSSNTTAGTGSGFGAPASVGFSTASKPAENALGFGFGGFGLGGQASSQANKTNPFGVIQGFGVATTSQSSLFGGKSGVDVFKMTDSPKPVFGSSLFSQSGFGTQSSGGFSGGSFSAQGGTVAASGFGFGASSPSGTTGFGSPQPFSSPSAGGSVFGGAPSFGSAPAFGGAPAFGSSPQGGLVASPSSGIFGSAPSGGFGQSQGSPTFGALATQSNLPSFGAVAGMPETQGFGGIQQQTPPSFGSFGGGGSGSQSPSGASFAQWR